MTNPSNPMRNKEETWHPGTSSGTEKARETASSVTEKAKDMASSAAQSAGEMASSATQRVKDAASTAMQTAGDAASNVARRAEHTASNLGGGMRSLAGTLRENLPHEGMMGQASTAVADTLERGGRYLEEEGLERITSDLANVIRRNPIPALFIGIGVGYLIARSMRR
jgi:hypothetical protein